MKYADKLAELQGSKGLFNQTSAVYRFVITADEQTHVIEEIGDDYVIVGKMGYTEAIIVPLSNFVLVYWAK